MSAKRVQNRPCFLGVGDLVLAAVLSRQPGSREGKLGVLAHASMLNANEALDYEH